MRASYIHLSPSLFSKRVLLSSGRSRMCFLSAASVCSSKTGTKNWSRYCRTASLGEFSHMLLSFLTSSSFCWPFFCYAATILYYIIYIMVFSFFLGLKAVRASLTTRSMYSALLVLPLSPLALPLRHAAMNANSTYALGMSLLASV